jgi:hypothetical protein
MQDKKDIRGLHFLVRMVAIMLFAFIVPTQMNASSARMNVSQTYITPMILNTAANNGLGQADITITNTGEEASLANEYTMQVIFNDIKLKDDDIANITGSILDYMTPEYDVGSNIITFRQTAPFALNAGYTVRIQFAVTADNTSGTPSGEGNGYAITLYKTADGGDTNPSSRYTYTEAKDAIAPPTVDSIDPTNNRQPAITGECEPGAEVTVQLNGISINPTATCENNGTYTVVPAIAIGEGEYNVTAIQEREGNTPSEPSEPEPLNIDTTVPTVTITETTQADDDMVTVIGATEPNTTVYVAFPSGEPVKVTSDAQGNYTATSIVAQEQSGTVTAAAQDEAGNVSKPATDTYGEKSTTPPTVSPIGSVDNTKPPISGTCEAGATVTVQIDGTNIEPSVICSTDGTYTVVPNDPIAEGEHDATATQTVDGVTSEPSEAEPLNIDTTAPTVTITETTQADDDMVTVAGTTEPSTTVNVTFPSGEIVEVTSDAQGNYTATSTVAQDQSGTVSAVAQDEAGNVSNTATDTYSTEVTTPDYMVKIGVIGSSTSGSDTTVPVTLTVSELLGGNNSGEVMIRIPKHDFISLTYNSNMTTLGNKTVNNNDWELINHATEYRFSYIGKETAFDPSSFSRIGLEVIVQPTNGTSGKIDFTADIKPGNGEDNEANNDDTAQIDYTN